DGSAMVSYFETAPLPTSLALFAHALPAAWHRIESRTTLFLELVVPFAFFATRRYRLAAAGLLTAFQVINAATANYGFFCYLATALHVFLLDDTDVERAWTAVAARIPLRLRQWSARWPRRVRDGVAKTPAGAAITVESDSKRRWRVAAIAGL